MTSAIDSGVAWLWIHKPDVAFVATLIAISVWMAVSVTRFEDRLAATENLVHDMNYRQLPEMRADFKEEFKEVHSEMKAMEERIDKRMDRIDDRLDKIELSLNTVVTYLMTKE